MFRRFRYFSSPQTLIPVGYFENWKVLAPRKVNPVTMDVCSAAIAFITLMMEKIPMVIPEVVRMERSLFTPNAFQAIFTSSQVFIATRIAKLPPDLIWRPARPEQNRKQFPLAR